MTIALQGSDALVAKASSAGVITVAVWGNLVGGNYQNLVPAAGAIVTLAGTPTSYYSPGGSVQAIVSFVQMCNPSGGSITVTQYSQTGAGQTQVGQWVIPTLGRLEYSQDGWKLYDGTGNAQTVGTPGATGPQGLAAQAIALEPDQGEEGMAIPGPVGPTGTQGPQGIQGPAGIAASAIAIEPDQGEEGMPVPGPTGQTGATGGQGIQGLPGVAVQFDADQGDDGFSIPPGPILPGTLTPSMFANAPANTVFGNNTGGSATPAFQTSISISGFATIGGLTSTNGGLTNGGSGGYFYNNYNAGGIFPTSAGGNTAQGWNFTNGSEEADFWNTIPAATDSFRFYQLTGVGTATLLLDILPSGNANFTGIVKGTGLTATGLSVAGFVTNTSGGMLGTSPLGTGVATFLGTPTSANLAAALTDETGSGAAVFANASVLKPKDVEGTVYIDPANTQGWSGSDVGAWINAAYAYLIANYYNAGTQVGGGIIQIAPGAYSQSTAAVCSTAGASLIIRGSGDGWGATVLTWTPTSGTQMTLGGGGSNAGGIQLEDITLSGGGTINTGSTGLQLGNATSGMAGATLKNVAIVRFGSGLPWFSATTVYAVHLINTKIEFCTTGATPLGENNVWLGGLIGSCGTGMLMSGAAEAQLFGLAFDDNTTTAININNNNARMSLDGCRFENSGGGTSVYITQSAGSISMVSGAFQNDTTSGTPATGFVQQTGGVSKYDGVWHGLGGAQVFTQCYNPTSPASIQVVNPIVAPGSSATALAALNWLPNAYDLALTTAVATATTTETIVKQRIVPLNTTDIGTTFRVEAHGVQSGTATTSLIWRLRYGPLGTISDPIAFASVAVAVAASAGCYVQGQAVIRTVGATGTIIGNAFSQGTTSTSSITAATVLNNSTQTNILTLTATAAVGTITTQNATIEQLQPN